MGSSLSCPCPGSAKEGVYLMRSDGSLLKLKKGISADEVAAAHAGHRVVRCGSRRYAVPGVAQLERHKLYFLMPEDKVQCRETYEEFWHAGEAKGLLPSRKTTTTGAWREGKGTPAVVNQGVVFDASDTKRPQWRPGLKTIEETNSPPVNDQVA